MLDILAITGPIYICIAIGFLTTRFGLFAKADSYVFGKFVVNLAVPSLLFKTLAERSIGEILNVDYVLAYLVGTFAVIGLGLFWCRKVARLNPTTGAFYTMGMACSNSVLVGYPVLLLTLPSVAGVAMALNTLLENIIVTPLMLALAEHGQRKSGRWYRVAAQSLARLLSNPMIIGLLTGFTVSLLGWKLPQPVSQTFGLLAMTTGALSLFVIGSTLVGLPLRGTAKKVTPIVIGKLILHPLAVFLSLLVLPMLGLPSLGPDLKMAAILMAAMPTLSIYPILAQLFGQEDFSAAALLITTAASFFTISGALLIFKLAPI